MITIIPYRQTEITMHTLPFTVEATEGQARAGQLETLRGPFKHQYSCPSVLKEPFVD